MAFVADIIPMLLAHPPPTAPNVLIVDDDEDDQFFIRQAFAECTKPYQLFFASDGIDCLKVLTETALLPDLVLLDLNMPRMNGFEVLQYVQNTPQWNGLTVIILSTTCDQPTQKLALGLGAADCMRKPSHYADYRPLVDRLYSVYL